MKIGLWPLIKKVYAKYMRPLIVKLIDNPNETWDDHVLALLDDLFDYNE
jgi:hypothetical protein